MIPGIYVGAKIKVSAKFMEHMSFVAFKNGTKYQIVKNSYDHVLGLKTQHAVQL